MTRIDAGAWRRANDDTHALHRGAADLVQRTLARHGLASGAGLPGGAARSPGDVIRDALAQAGLARAGQTRPPQPAAPAPMPKGASFDQATHAGKTGARAFRTYIPASAATGAAGIIVMLHGCTQTPEDFAIGTGMNAHAEQHRLIVIYPEQSRGANAQTCWNWFSKGDQARGRGEPEIIAGLTRQAMQRHGIARHQTFVAGLSAGAAMAVILGHAYPDVFAAVGAHSGLPLGAAHDVPSAFAAMAGTGGAAHNLPPSDVRTIIVHGGDDRTVHPANGAAIAQMAETRLNGTSLRTDKTGEAGGRRYRRAITLDAGGQSHLEHWVVEGLGHAWSGGHPGGSYADPAGPDASAEMIQFFLQIEPKGHLT